MEKIHIDDIVEKVENEIALRRSFNSEARVLGKEVKKEIVVIKPEISYDKNKDIHPLKARLMKKGVVAELYQEEVDKAGGYKGNILLNLQDEFDLNYE